MTVADLVAEQVARRPDAVALVRGDVTLSYAGLGHAVGVLAGRLARIGVGRGDFVPLLMRGGPASPVSMIAAMRLGAPFVPLHADWPAERVRATLAALAPKVVLTDGPVDDAAVAGVPVLEVDVAELAAAPTALAGPAGSAGGDVRPEFGPDDLCYGFFTSGSTGVPKCALNVHRGLLNRFRVMTDRFGGANTVLQNSPHVFDSSLWQLLWPLTTGGCVVLPEHRGLDLLATVETMATHGVTMTDFVPSVFGTLVEVLDTEPALAGRLGSLRYLLIGGEEIDPKAVRRFSAHVGQVRVVNTYGPTEASIGFVFHEVTKADADEIPIGRAIDGTTAVVVTETGALAGPGELGEICAAGECLGLGYLDDPEATARAFVPNPFPDVPGDRLYRTGDLGYWGTDGLLRFAGRRDHQVKIGGVRIELLEVEAAVATHPDVRTAKVVVVGDGEARAMVCFVVPDGAASAALPTQLAGHLAGLLPEYCIPRRFVVLDRMPLTPNGKADRQALAALARAGEAGGGATVSPEHQEVHRLWSALLCSEDLGPDSDFFACGGTSLLAYRLALSLSELAGVPVSVRDVVARPTLREQAALVAGSATTGSATTGSATVGRGDRHDEEAIRADVTLPPDVVGCRAGAGGAGGPRRVLLTGATGFVGRQLLADLLERTDADVVCLVRAADDESARRRLRAVVPDAGRLPGDVRPAGGRVVPVAADLGSPGLGLPARRFRELAGEADAVVHAGAVVNLVAGYAALRAVNVEAVRDLLRFATLGEPKQLVHLSTLGVLPASTRADELDRPGAVLPADGYSRSKWAAEQVLALARGRGIGSTVVRLGEIMAHSGTGVGDERSVLTTLVRVCADLGLRFATDAVTDWTPVDVVSRVVVDALVRDLAPSGALHLLRPGGVRLDAVLDRLDRIVPLRAVDYPTFRAAVDVRASLDPVAARLAMLLPDPDGAEAARLPGLVGDASAHYRAEAGSALVARLGHTWPDVDDAALDAYLRWAVTG